MVTSKYVAISLIVALAGIVAVGQDRPAAPSQAVQRAPSNTRLASCLVRMTVDPAILPLDPQTVSSLVHSPGVLGKAAREVLSLNTPEDLERFSTPQDGGRSGIMVRWLNASAAPMLPGARPLRQSGDSRAYEEENMRNLERAYGPAYMQQMAQSPGQGKKGEAGEGQAGGVSQPNRRSGQSSGSDSQNDRMSQGSSGGYGMGAAGGFGGAGGSMGGMGGMMMGGGGMGMGGGMMQGYGAMGGMGFGVAPGAAQAETRMAASATFELQVSLPETVPPRADEFLKEVVKNLRQSLLSAYVSYQRDIEGMLDEAKGQLRNVEETVNGTAGEASAATRRIRQQLEQVVDLSGLKPQTPLAEAIDVLRKAVVPPLNIVVLWNDLMEHLSIEPTSPIKVDGMQDVKLGTMLDLLLKGLPAGDAKPMWRIRDDVIVVGTTATFGQFQESARGPRVETDARNLGGQRSELARNVQSLELQLAGLEARQKAIQEQIAATRDGGNKRLAEDTVTQELQRLVEISEHNLSQLRQSAQAGRVSAAELAEAEKNMAQARIDLARRREELSGQAGGRQLDEFTKELSRLAINKAEWEAQLQIVRKQLDEVQRQLMQALTFDPEAARLHMAQESLDITSGRVAELQMRLSNLQPPIVTTIGAN